MTTLKTINTSSEKLNSLLEALKKGQLNQEALDELVATAHSIYETALILRYKAYEHKVFGLTTTEDISSSFPLGKDTTMEVAQETVQELPLFDLSFDTEENKQDNSNEGTTDSVSELETISEEKLIEKEHDLEEEVISADAVNESTDNIPFTNDTLTTPSMETPLPSIATEEIVQITTITDEPITEQAKNPIDAPSDIQANIEFIQRHKTITPDEMAQIRMTKLESLVGSFGLNERLQYINELFKGSSEEFSTAIKELDKPVSFEEVLMKTSVYAVDFSWEKESETVADFISKLKRRHA